MPRPVLGHVCESPWGKRGQPGSLSPTWWERPAGWLLWDFGHREGSRSGRAFPLGTGCRCSGPVRIRTQWGACPGAAGKDDAETVLSLCNLEVFIPLALCWQGWKSRLEMALPGPAGWMCLGVARAATLPLETRALGLGLLFFLTVSFHLLCFSNLITVEIQPLASHFLIVFSDFSSPSLCGALFPRLSASFSGSCFGFRISALSVLIRGLSCCRRLLLQRHLVLKAMSSLVLVGVLAALERPPLHGLCAGTPLRGLCGLLHTVWVASSACGSRDTVNGSFSLWLPSIDRHCC